MMDYYQKAMQNVFDRFVHGYKCLDFTDQDARRITLLTMKTNSLVPRMVMVEQETLIREKNENVQAS